MKASQFLGRLFAITLLSSVVLWLIACGEQNDPQQSREQNSVQTDNTKKTEVAVYVASSMIDAVGQVAAAYEAENNVAIQINAAASSTLARQIIAGAPADIYISANEKWMDALAEKNLLDNTSRKDLVANQLVAVALKGSSLLKAATLAKIVASHRIAIGDPSHVPAGMYAKQALIYLGQWDKIQSKLIPTMDVRAALYLVQLGEVDAALVYRTDAMVAPNVSVIYQFPNKSHVPIFYPAAMLARANKSAKSFYDYLFTAKARTIFEHAGFVKIETDDKVK